MENYTRSTFARRKNCKRRDSQIGTTDRPHFEKKYSYHGDNGRHSFHRNNHRRNTNRERTAKVDVRKYISKPVENIVVTQPKSVKTLCFDELCLNESINKNLKLKGYTTTTEIQTEAIPHILQGKDLLGISATGSGKTAAFLIPMIQKILNDNTQKLLVVAPTRELAMQIQKEAISLVRNTFIRVERVIGGESIFRQGQYLRTNPSIIVGTPGRIIDMQDRKYIDLGKVNNIVLDEVDRMLDMGFVHDIKNILEMSSKTKQLLFFSATMDKSVLSIVNSISPNYVKIELVQNKPIDTVKQNIVRYKDKDDKIQLLQDLLKREEIKKSLIFIETKRYADKIEHVLVEQGFKAGAIHGGKDQNKRTRILQKYRQNEIKILVATNVAARGLDIDDITHVINYDEPQTYEEYIHRIGRTGRNGKEGFAFTFVEQWR